MSTSSMPKRTSARLIKKEEEKKLREKSLFDNFQHPEELSLLENLLRCDHVLENIIEYLPKKDILSLTLTSKTLNLFISENPKILENFTVSIPQITDYNKERYDFNNIRRYPKWKLKHGIYSGNVGTVMEFLMPYGPYVKSLEIRAKQGINIGNILPVSQSSKKSLIAIISCCQNLQELDIGYTPWLYNKSEVLNLPKLRKLQFCSKSSTLLTLFMNSQLQSLDMNLARWELDQSEIECVWDFLNTQRELENLRLRSCPLQLFDANGMMTVNLKLKSLTLELDRSPSTESENLGKFINLHKNSLLELTLKNVNSTLMRLEKFNKIKTLTLEYSSINNSSAVWPSVEKLTIIGPWGLFYSRTALQRFEQLFPNVKEIKIKGKDIDHDFLDVLPNVEKLEVDYCRISANLTCSNLKVLHMIEVTIGARFNLIWDNNQLKELVVKEGTNNARFIEQLLMHEDTNLDRLKLVGRNYLEANSPALHQVINQNRQKIKILTIVERDY